MARDYKNPRHKTSSARSAVPGWIWLVSGVAIGLFVALLVWLDKRPAVSPDSASPVPAAETPPPTKKPGQIASPDKKKADPKSDTAATEKPRFEFYTILPEMEIIVPGKEIKNPVRPARPGTYFLQTGSFKNMPDADALKARLALLGMEAKIEPVTVEGDTWYRVRLGPFKDMDQLNKMLGDLRQNNINALPVRVKS